jgi:hypothetical protein
MITRHLQMFWEEWHRSLLVKVFLAILILSVFCSFQYAPKDSPRARDWLSDMDLLVFGCDVL